MNSTRMPVLDFNKNEYAQFTTGAGLGSVGKNYLAPRYKLSQVANGVASQGQLLNFPAPSPNSSYQMDFMAPSLQCNAIEGTMRDTFVRNISKVLGCSLETPYASTSSKATACYKQTLYLAWAPSEDGAFAFNGTTDATSQAWSGQTVGQLGQVDSQGNMPKSPASLYIASQSSLDNSQPWSFINCSLYNASYHVAVNFTSGTQDVKASKKLTNTVGYTQLFDIIGSASANGSVDPMTGQSALLNSDLTQFGYQSVMDTFGRLLSGQIVVEFRGAAGYFMFSTLATSVMTTSLTNTVGLSPILQIAEVCSGGAASCNGKSTNQGLNITNAPASSLPLNEAAEQLFENITLSLFSNDVFL